MAVSGIGTAYNILYDYQSRTQGTEQENKQSERFSDALSADGKTVPYGAMAKDGAIGVPKVWYLPVIMNITGFVLEMFRTRINVSILHFPVVEVLW